MDYGFGTDDGGARDPFDSVGGLRGSQDSMDEFLAREFSRRRQHEKPRAPRDEPWRSPLSDLLNEARRARRRDDPHDALRDATLLRARLDAERDKRAAEIRREESRLRDEMRRAEEDLARARPRGWGRGVFQVRIGRGAAADRARRGPARRKPRARACAPPPRVPRGPSEC